MKSDRMLLRMRRSQATVACTILLGLTAPACGDDTPDDAETNDASAAGDANGPDAAADAGEPSPLYLAATRIWDAQEQATSYFHVLASLDEGTLVDSDRALEVAGAAKLYASEGLGWFAIGGGEDPTITRYTLSDDDQLVEGERISLQPYGVTSLWDTLYFVSPTKAYYPDRANSQLIVWNPTAMEITGSVALPQTEREGYLSLYGYTPVVHGDKLIFTVGWFDWDVNDDVLGETGLVVLDTQRDTVESFEVDTRCAGITQGVVLESGDAYFASSALAGAARRLDRLETEPCALRVLADEDAFDADYLERLEPLTGFAIAGEPMPDGDDGILLRAFDEELATVEPENLTYELTGQAAWRWLRWDPAKNEVEAIETLEPSTADVLWFQVDGQVLGTETAEDYSETTVIDLTAAGGPRRGLTAPGFLHGLARIR